MATITEKMQGQPTGLRQRLISGVLWNLVAMIASRGSTLVVTIIVARVLGTAKYGEIGIIQSTIGMFGTFAGMGLGVTCTKYLAELKYEDPARAGRIIALTHMVGWFSASILALSLLGLAPWLAVSNLANPGLTRGLQLSSLLLLFSTITGLQGGTLAGFEAFREMARIGVIQGICSFPLIIAGVYWGGVEGAIIGLGLSNVVGYLLNFRAISSFARKASIRPCYRNAWQEHSVLKQTAIPSMLSGIMVGPVVWYGNALVVNEPGGYAQLGIFNAVNQWKVLLTFLPAVIGNVLLPMLSATTKTKNSRLEAFNLLGNWLMVTPIALCLMAVPEVVSLLYGSAYAGESFNQCLALMMMVSIVLAFKEGIARKLVVGNLLWWGMLSNLLWAAFFLCGVYLFRSKGAFGLAFAYAISYVINTLIFVPFYLRRKVVSKELLLSWNILIAWGTVIALLCMTFITNLLWIRLVALFAAFTVLCLTLKRLFAAGRHEDA